MNFFSNVVKISVDEIDKAVEQFGVAIPEQLKVLVLEHNGASIECESGRMSSLISFSKSKVGNIYDLYALPPGYLPFGDDGAEGCYAISSDPNEGVVLWRHGTLKQPIAPTFEAFLRWLDEE